MRCRDEEEVTATCARRTRAIIPRRSKRSSGRRSRVACSLSDRCRVAPSVRLRSMGALRRVTALLQATDAPVAEDDCAREGEKLWGAGNPFRRTAKIERECGAHDVEAVRYTNVCCFFDLRMGARLCVGFLAPARASRGYGVPLAFLKSSRSRVPRTHTRTHAGGGGPFAGAAEKEGLARGCGRQQDGVQGAACCGRARRRVPGRGLAMWAPREPAGREGGRNMRGAARERRPKTLCSWAPPFFIVLWVPSGGGVSLGCGLLRRMRIATLPPARRCSGPVSEGRGAYFKRPGNLLPMGVGGGCCLRAACRENTPTRTRRGGAAIPRIWAAALGGSEQRSAAADCVSTEVLEGIVF
ncbi:uncharacterized protein Tco025E_09690 [Trypanosoma conorhini]|uniref:Uncharacterized protein n=1 Tax=Trypanosoma conorhini TaxID=83891 RepID=A0A422MTQ2_9TRYP|nr:uncharacterized protein Tco025E_09690 [Trypanosoma conorhini]RNE96618.1 hypothetical protein Tco025E_09690 [Trypanosoma conorhini]